MGERRKPYSAPEDGMVSRVRATDVPKLILLAIWTKKGLKMTKWGDRVFEDHFLAKF